MSKINMFPVRRVGVGQKMQLRREYASGNPSPDSMLLLGEGGTSPLPPVVELDALLPYDHPLCSGESGLLRYGGERAFVPESEAVEPWRAMESLLSVGTPYPLG